MRIIKISSPRDAKAAIKDQLKNASSSRLFALFYGTEDPVRGLSSWCPDCVRAFPLVEKWIDSLDTNATLIKLSVDKNSWRSTEFIHPYKNDPEFRLERLPTLIYWDGNKSAEVGRLVENECSDEGKWKKLIS